MRLTVWIAAVSLLVFFGQLNWFILWSAGGTNILLYDVFAVLMMAVGLRQWFVGGETLSFLYSRKTLLFLVVMFAAMVTLSLVRGLMEYGLAALGEARWYTGFVIMIATYLCIRNYRDARILIWVVLLSGLYWAVMSVLVHLGVIGFFAHQQTGVRYAGGRSGSLIAIVGVMALAYAFFEGKLKVAAITAGVILLTLALVSGAGSPVLVIVAALGALCVAIVVGSKRFYAPVAAVLLVICVAMIAYWSGTLDAVSRRFANIAEYGGTWGWRFIRWENEMGHIFSSAERLLFGSPMGMRFSFFGDNPINDYVDPHNDFINIWSRTGLLGLLSYLGILGYFLAHLTGTIGKMKGMGHSYAYVRLTSLALIIILLSWTMVMFANAEISFWGSGVLMWIFFGVALRWLDLLEFALERVDVEEMVPAHV